MTEMEMKICKGCGRELPVTMFVKTRWGGYFGTCKDCVSKKKELARASRMQELDTKRLQDFTPRELMLELKRRGYEGNLRYIEVHHIDISKLD